MAVPPPPPQADPADKATLRSALRRARVAFAARPEAAAANAALVARLMPLLARGGPIAGYVPHRGEPDILPVLRAAHDLGIGVALPHVVGDGVMHFAPWHPDMMLAAGALGIPQPGADADAVVPAIVLAPLVGFDRAGRRLGQGGGYYDRWFAAHPQVLRVGVAWRVQEVPALPHDEWDVPLHAIVTDQDWITP